MPNSDTSTRRINDDRLHLASNIEQTTAGRQKDYNGSILHFCTKLKTLHLFLGNESHDWVFY